MITGLVAAAEECSTSKQDLPLLYCNPPGSYEHRHRDGAQPQNAHCNRGVHHTTAASTIAELFATEP
jgi:hypothetical protein